MLQVLDVARTLRRDQEIAESELNRAELRVALRERLLAAAAAAGDRVTSAEVDAAIAVYFQHLHTYADPPWSLSLLAAQLYVRRRLLAAVLLLLATFGILWWWLFRSPGGAFSTQTRARQALARQQEQAARQGEQWSAAVRDFDQHLTAARAIAEDPAATGELDRLEREAATVRISGDLAHLERLRASVAGVEQRLRLEYEVRIVSAPGRLSGVEREYEGRFSGAYLIVEARTPDGRILPRTITSREDRQTRTVSAWGEQVPLEVLQRIETDKRADGVVDESLFAVKRRGRLEEEVQLAGTDGRPLKRQGQILEW